MEAVKRAGSPKGVSVTAQDLFKQVMRDEVGPGLRAMGFRGSYTRSASSKMAPRHVTNGEESESVNRRLSFVRTQHRIHNTGDSRQHAKVGAGDGVAWPSCAPSRPTSRMR